jgi:hypothetical protein
MSVQEAASTKAEQRTGQIRCKESRRSHPRLNLSTDGKFRNYFTSLRSQRASDQPVPDANSISALIFEMLVISYRHQCASSHRQGIAYGAGDIVFRPNG